MIWTTISSRNWPLIIFLVAILVVSVLMTAGLIGSLKGMADSLREHNALRVVEFDRLMKQCVQDGRKEYECLRIVKDAMQ